MQDGREYSPRHGDLEAPGRAGRNIHYFIFAREGKRGRRLVLSPRLALKQATDASRFENHISSVLLGCSGPGLYKLWPLNSHYFEWRCQLDHATEDGSAGELSVRKR